MASLEKSEIQHVTDEGQDGFERADTTTDTMGDDHVSPDAIGQSNPTKGKDIGFNTIVRQVAQAPIFHKAIIEASTSLGLSP
jgi:hypothetical protein